MNAFSNDVGGAVEAYAAYLNAPRGFLSSDEQELFDEDMARARAAMERAWLEATPVQGDTP
jgi:GAF domain-containing protein